MALEKARRQTEEISAAAAALERVMPGVEVNLSGVTGGPSEVVDRRGALTGAAPGAGSETIVREFLGRHSALTGSRPPTSRTSWSSATGPAARAVCACCAWSSGSTAVPSSRARPASSSTVKAG
ncbi:MAG TPA: hypothetical protein VEL74_10095 [Thermoanaerobaculia bacterium]|nr:hypothetical protein [Thermoanaerobaculia bacterium]